METKIINVITPTFYVLKTDPTDVSYESHHNSDNWKFIQTAFIGFDVTLKEDDILYIYEKNNNEKSFRGAILNKTNIK